MSNASTKTSLHPTGQAKSQDNVKPDMNMLMDVGMTLSLEVGRTQIQLRDLLNVTKGSIIELDKLSGDALDIIANGKKIAQGEVVSVNGKYGVRITSVSQKADLT